MGLWLRLRLLEGDSCHCLPCTAFLLSCDSSPTSCPACPTPPHPSTQPGWTRDVITQNVDRLHARAGSPSVLELHGTTHEVVCMSCSHLSCRHEFQELLAALNPDAAAAAAALAAQQDAADDMRRLLRAGTAAAVHPSLRETDSSSSSSGGSASGSSASGSSSSGAVLLQRPDGDAQVRCLQASCAAAGPASGRAPLLLTHTERSFVPTLSLTASRCSRRRGGRTETWRLRAAGAALSCRPAPAAAAS